jgi:hypothetical protein
MHSTWHALLQDVELMPQYQDFGFQSPSRLEAIAQRADEKEADCNHAASCSDSPVTASQMDWVFGSDRQPRMGPPEARLID